MSVQELLQRVQCVITHVGELSHSSPSSLLFLFIHPIYELLKTCKEKQGRSKPGRDPPFSPQDHRVQMEAEKKLCHLDAAVVSFR